MIRQFRKYWNRWESYKTKLTETHPKTAATVKLIETLFWATCIALILRQFIVQSSLVFSGSMIPTLAIDDRLIVNKLVYNFNAPNRGDIVLFNSPYGDGKQYVKRLIGLPGETIEIRRGVVYINNQPTIFPGVTIRRDYSFKEKEVIPENAYFMLGDNRANSADSRVWGVAPKDTLIGEALFIYWPINRIRWVR